MRVMTRTKKSGVIFYESSCRIFVTKHLISLSIALRIHTPCYFSWLKCIQETGKKYPQAPHLTNKGGVTNVSVLSCQSGKNNSVSQMKLNVLTRIYMTEYELTSRKRVFDKNMLKMWMVVVVVKNAKVFMLQR